MPVSKIDEFLKLCHAGFQGSDLTEKQSLPCSILLSQTKNETEILECLAQDLVKLDALGNEYKNCKILSFEICFPNACYAWEEAKLSRLFGHYFKQLSLFMNSKNDFEFFCEMPFSNHETVKNFLSFVHQFNLSHRSQKIFIKLRTGGVTPESIPSIQHLSYVIFALSELLIPFKVTAGLHVPIPNFNPDVKAKMHGFLNVLFGGILVFSKADLPLELRPRNTQFDRGIQTPYEKLNIVEDIIGNLNYTHLNFHTDNVILSVPSDTQTKISFSNSMIREFREKYFKGIGSCDFIEPIDHLVKWQKTVTETDDQ